MVGCRHAGAQGTFRLSIALAVLSASPILLGFFAAPASASGVIAAGELPGARVGAASVSVGGGIFYVIGGRSGTNYLDDIVRYDANSGTSEVVAHLPVSVSSGTAGRQDSTALWTGSRIFVFGGASLSDTVVQGQHYMIPKSIPDIVTFDPSSGSVGTLAVTNALPTSLWGMGGVWVGDHGYLFGGFHFDIADATNPASRKDWVMKFDPSPPLGGKDVTLLAATLPYEVQDMGVAVLGGKAWLLGGLAENNTANVCPIIQYQDDNGTQSRYKPTCASASVVKFDLDQEIAGPARGMLPARVQFAGAAVAAEKIVLFGGRNEDGSADSHIVSYDVSTESATTLFPTLPGGRFGMPVSAVPDSDSILIFGGRDAGAFHDGMKDVLRFEGGATPPWSPRSLIAESKPGSPTISLKWDPPIYDGGAAVTGYNVYRIPINGTVQLLGKVAGSLSYADASAAPGAAYVYRVTASNKAGESTTGVEADTRAPARPPSAPVGFQAFAGDGKVVLRWRAPAEIGGSAIGEYRVYRDPSPDPQKPYIFQRPDILFVNDSTVENGQIYTYTVAAVNGMGEGQRATSPPVKPDEVPSQPRILAVSDAATALQITWTLEGSGNSASGFRVYRGTEPDHLALVTTDPISDNAFKDESVERGQLYYYAVAGVNTRGEGPWSDVTSGGLIDAPSPPRNLLATAAPGRVDLKWIPPEDSGGASSLSYIVTRTGPDGTPRIIASDVRVLTYSDRDVLPGVTYRYAISAFNGRQSPDSTPKSVAPLAIENHPPSAAIDAIGGTRWNSGEVVKFDASRSSDPDEGDRIATYTWDWGDGTPVNVTTQPSAQHKFLPEQTFFVKLTVKDQHGALSTNAAQLTIDIGAAAKQDNGPQDGTDPVNVKNLPPTVTNRPGSETPKLLPGFEPALALLALVACALVARRRT